MGVDAPLVARELEAVATATAGHFDRVPHHRLADPSPAYVGRDVDRFDLRDEPAAVREASRDREVERPDDAPVEPRHVETGAGVRRDVVECVEIRRELAVAGRLRVRAEVVVGQETEDGLDVVARRELDDEGRDDGLQPRRASFRA
jgi:hypothetical protein